MEATEVWEASTATGRPSSVTTMESPVATPRTSESACAAKSSTDTVRGIDPV